MQTSDYTYIGNENPNEETTRLILRGGALILNLGEWAALSDFEYKSLVPRYKLTPGRSTIEGGQTKAIFKLSDLADVAISGIDDGLTIIWDEDTGVFIPGTSLVGPKGDKGDKGDEGETGQTGSTGPQGPSGGVPYHYVQADPANDVTIMHNLGAIPNVIVIDSAGTEVEGEIQYIDLNTVRLIFTGPFSFDAYLSP